MKKLLSESAQKIRYRKNQRVYESLQHTTNKKCSRITYHSKEDAKIAESILNSRGWKTSTVAITEGRVYQVNQISPYYDTPEEEFQEYECPFCHNDTANFSEYQGDTVVLKCDNCGKFSYLELDDGDGKAHRSYHPNDYVGSDYVDYECPYCHHDTLNFSEYQGNTIILKCDTCGKYSYSTEEDLANDRIFTESRDKTKHGKVKKGQIDAGLGGLNFVQNPVGGMNAFNTGIGGPVGEQIEKHNELNGKLFDENNEIKPEVKDKLLEIVDKFIENLKQDDIKLEVKDVQIIGSNASYNYTKDSDIDLHIFADLSVYKDNEDLAQKLYNQYKSLFNNKYDPTIYGIDVEVYVEPYQEAQK